MIYLAAASEQGSAGGGWPTLLALAALWTAGWLISVRIWPYTKCRRCGGSGLSGGSNRQRWNVCRRCNGTREQRRFGAPPDR